jgi:glycosyltransferase involved in cell wall biosynthesis
MPFHYVRRKLTAQVDYAVAVSAFLMARHRQFGCFNGARQKIIHNATTPPDSTVQNQVQNPLRFGFIGRIEKIKGVELLLEVFRGMATDRATLTLAGTGDMAYVRTLQKIFAGARVEFLGFVPAAEFYRRVDVLIVPSLWHEAQSLVVMEALSHGIPVIGALRGGIPEILEEGKTGFLFDPSRPAALQEKMQIFLEHPGTVTQMEQHCRGRAEEFTPETFCRQYMEVYRSLI